MVYCFLKLVISSLRYGAKTSKTDLNYPTQRHVTFKPGAEDEEGKSADQQKEMVGEKRPKNAAENVAKKEQEKVDDEHGRKPRS